MRRKFHSSRWVGVWLVAFVALVAGFLVPGVAQAHSGEESYVYLEVFDDVLEGRVEFPVKDLSVILGIDIPEDEEGALAATEENLEAIQAYAAEHLSLGQDGQEWVLDFDGFFVIPAFSGTYSVVEFVVAEDFETVPRVFDATYDGVIEAFPQKSALLLIETDFGSGTFNNESNHLLRFTPENTSQVVNLEDPSFIAGLTGTVELGIEHIFIGADHILFIAALVLPAVLIFMRPKGWVPAPDFRSSLWRVVKIVTSFTIAHTITLTLGGLGIVEFPPALVESIIAISIALAAWHNLRPFVMNREWLIAFVFGLFHGFGFAGLLSDLGIDRSNRIVSLLGFNLGIEIGQIAIILLIFPALYIARRTRYYLPFMQVGSMVLIAISLGWFFDRAFGFDSGVDTLVTRLFISPRPILLVVGLTLAAIAAYYIEKGAGRLLPLPDIEDASEREGRTPSSVT